MINRNITKGIQEAVKGYPVIGVLGPRQSGKTTLVKNIFNKHEYVSCEDFDKRNFFNTDPRGFIAHHTKNNPHGVIFDEVQNIPKLLSYLQTIVDEDRRLGYFVLTGSHNFLLHEKISQTLAGRIALFTLLPFSISELQQASKLPEDEYEMIFTGSYPSLYTAQVTPGRWYQDYLNTYIERDVRSITTIVDLSLFQTFIRLCAGRIGQLLNITSLANDCGISVGTVRSWISVLEASYVIFLLQPHFNNFSKRLVKSPKLYFYDTGFACLLLEIESAKQAATHYLRGGLFESLIIGDLLKQRRNQGKLPNCYFWRDKMGNEVDCLISKAGQLTPIEIKAGKTVTQDYFKGLQYYAKVANLEPSESVVVYTGDQNQERAQGRVIGWKSVGNIQ